MSILYCTIPYFGAALARRDNPDLASGPLVLVGPEERVWDVSVEAAARGIVAGLPARTAAVRCPQAHLLDADIARHQEAFETLLELLELASSRVEPHGRGAAYVDLGDGVPTYSDAVTLCQQVGRTVRRELGGALQPALGWDRHKFTAQTAARRAPAGRLLAIDVGREQRFLQPLPVTLLPLSQDTLQRLGFLGLRTLGQYAGLPAQAVKQQFGRAGWQAQRYARGEDDRPVVPRHQLRRLTAHYEFEGPVAERGLLLAALEHITAPLWVELEGSLQACGQVSLRVDFDGGRTQEQKRTFLSPTAEKARLMQALGRLLDGMHWCAGAVGLSVTLGQIQDVVIEQLALFSAAGSNKAQDEKRRKLQEVQRYLATRFGAQRLRRAILSQPGAPLPEWRVDWLEDAG